MRGGGHEDRAEAGTRRHSRGDGPAHRNGGGLGDPGNPYSERRAGCPARGRPVGRTRRPAGPPVLRVGHRLPGTPVGTRTAPGTAGRPALVAGARSLLACAVFPAFLVFNVPYPLLAGARAVLARAVP